MENVRFAHIKPLPVSPISIPNKGLSFKTDGPESYKQYQRLTISLNEPAELQKMMTTIGPIAKQFDIIAVQPNTEELFKACCKDVDLDIITIDLSKILPFRIKPVQQRLIKSRNIFIELQLSMGSFNLKSGEFSFSAGILGAIEIISAMRGGKNIIISSGAGLRQELRSPYDLINLACLLGMSPEIAKKALTSNPAMALQHGASRKLQMGIMSMSIIEVSEISQSDPSEFTPLHPNAHNDDLRGKTKVEPKKSVPKKTERTKQTRETTSQTRETRERRGRTRQRRGGTRQRRGRTRQRRENKKTKIKTLQEIN
eukprot:TRINITY_DN2584_c0_g1_i1.p1 TRINITY_DN2584_c0_g1~~TRINITY_DN2584_c0_g1_i1.p1  ORF type:complete len:352 (+),score=49.65 TRINITY_DN2584_c0_g1_i1:120-1058(+)